MSHRHYCDVAGHSWECEGKALRGAATEPTVCKCLPCCRPLEGFDHRGCHAPIELLACPEHWSADASTGTARQAKPHRASAVVADEDGNPVYAFCLWCGRTFYCWAEVEARNRDNMKACPVHVELTQRPGGYPYLPPLLQDIPERAGLPQGQGAEKCYGPN
jgi:hypothetical protein